MAFPLPSRDQLRTHLEEIEKALRGQRVPPFPGVAWPSVVQMAWTGRKSFLLLAEAQDWLKILLRPDEDPELLKRIEECLWTYTNFSYPERENDNAAAK